MWWLPAFLGSCTSRLKFVDARAEISSKSLRRSLTWPTDSDWIPSLGRPWLLPWATVSHMLKVALKTGWNGGDVVSHRKFRIFERWFSSITLLFRRGKLNDDVMKSGSYEETGFSPFQPIFCVLHSVRMRQEPTFFILWHIGVIGKIQEK